MHRTDKHKIGQLPLVSYKLKQFPHLGGTSTQCWEEKFGRNWLLEIWHFNQCFPHFHSSEQNSYRNQSVLAKLNKRKFTRLCSLSGDLQEFLKPEILEFTSLLLFVDPQEIGGQYGPLKLALVFHWSLWHSDSNFMDPDVYGRRFTSLDHCPIWDPGD